MAEENKEEIVQESTQDAKVEDKKDKKEDKPAEKGKKKDKANTVYFPEGASEKEIEKRQKELKKQYKVGRPTIMQILTAVLSGLVFIGIVVAFVVIVVTES